jgi:hypothetical protein
LYFCIYYLTHHSISCIYVLLYVSSVILGIPPQADDGSGQAGSCQRSRMSTKRSRRIRSKVTDEHQTDQGQAGSGHSRISRMTANTDKHQCGVQGHAGSRMSTIRWTRSSRIGQTGSKVRSNQPDHGNAYHVVRTTATAELSVGWGHTPTRSVYPHHHKWRHQADKKIMTNVPYIYIKLYFPHICSSPPQKRCAAKRTNFELIFLIHLSFPPDMFGI